MGHLLCLLIPPQTWEVSSFNVPANSNIRAIFNFAGSGLCVMKQKERFAMSCSGTGHSVKSKSWKKIHCPFLGAGCVSSSGTSAWEMGLLSQAAHNLNYAEDSRQGVSWSVSAAPPRSAGVLEDRNVAGHGSNPTCMAECAWWDHTPPLAAHSCGRKVHQLLM